MKTVATACLLCAWMCASGAMLGLVQVAAWGHMFAGYARSESLSAAARETFDPDKPCALCRAVSKAHQAADTAALAKNAADKLVLMYERPAAWVVRAATPGWPTFGPLHPAARSGDVPVPPPRTVAA